MRDSSNRKVVAQEKVTEDEKEDEKVDEKEEKQLHSYEAQRRPQV